MKICPPLEQVQVGYELPQRAFDVDNVQLFLYNAVLWNAHRIHYDHPYTQQVEGYSGLVIAGPLMGDWLAQCVEDWLQGRGVLQAFEYRNRRAAYVGETLYSGGRVQAVDLHAGTLSLDLQISNPQGEVMVPGSAVVRMTAD